MGSFIFSLYCSSLSHSLSKGRWLWNSLDVYSQIWSVTCVLYFYSTNRYRNRVAPMQSGIVYRGLSLLTFSSLIFMQTINLKTKSAGRLSPNLAFIPFILFEQGGSKKQKYTNYQRTDVNLRFRCSAPKNWATEVGCRALKFLYIYKGDANVRW
jgi:hypothetical protein